MYYFVDETDHILEALGQLPSQSQLQEMADEFHCPIYVIEGQHIGMTAYPSVPEYMVRKEQK